MFNLFGDSVFGQFGNTLVNQKLGDSKLGSLAEYMNNQYGNGSKLDAKGMPIPTDEDDGKAIGGPIGMPPNPYVSIDSQPTKNQGILGSLIKTIVSAL